MPKLVRSGRAGDASRLVCSRVAPRLYFLLHHFLFSNCHLRLIRSRTARTVMIAVQTAEKHESGSMGIAPNMSRALSRDKFGQTPCFSGPGLIIWPASLPRWTCLDRRASSQSNIRGFAGRAAAASDRRGSPPRALYVAGVASQFVATAGGVTFGLKSLPAGVPREQRPRE